MTKREKPQRVQQTNAMRELEAAGISFEVHQYDVDDSIPSGELGVRIAESLGEDVNASFKTPTAVMWCVASRSHKSLISKRLRQW